nr:hypothetical protein [Tanacetum cinerariifolium]
MSSLADKAILSGADNCPPMLEKDMYDSWRSRIELYMLNRQHGRMILESVEHGPLLWPTVEENEVTRLKKYSELSVAEAIQADCDVKAKNIILQALPLEIYALVSTHKVAKDLWERIQMLMQGTSLTKPEQECKLYDAFDKFVYQKEERHIFVSQGPSSSTHSISYPATNTSSFVNHNAYIASSSAPQIDYALMVQQSSEYSPPKAGLVGRQNFVSAGSSRPFSSGSRGAPGKQRVIVCYNCKGEVQAQANGQVLQEEELEFLADPGIAESSSNQTNLTLPALQDDLILSVIEQLKTQVVTYTKINQDNKHVNDLLTAELERYRSQERVLNERKHDEKASTSYESSQEIESLKHTLSEHLKEKESLEQKITILKNDFQKEETRNIDRELALEKQTQQLKPKLYDGRIIEKSDAVVIPDTEETLMLAEESRSKMIEKQKDPQMTEKKIELSTEQAFWSQYSVQTDEPNLSVTTTIVEVPKELPKVSMNKMEHVLRENDRLLTQALSVEIINVVVHDNVMFDCLNVDVCAHCVTTESELKKDFIKKESYKTLLQQYHNLDKHCISLEVNTQLKREIFQKNTLSPSESALAFAEFFEINELKAQAQAKDTMILQLKEKLCSLKGDVTERNVKREVKEIETLNIELDHKVTKRVVENEHLKQTYKQLYDSIKSSRVRSKEQCDDLINKVNLKSAEVSDLNASIQEKVLVITALKEQLSKLKGKAVLTEAVSLNPIDPELLKVDVAPLAPKLRKNRTAHIDYIRHTLDEPATLREIVKRVILVSSASGSMSQDNTKKNRIHRTQRKAKKNKVEDHLRNVKS